MEKNLPRKKEAPGFYSEVERFEPDIPEFIRERQHRRESEEYTWASTSRAIERNMNTTAQSRSRREIPRSSYPRSNNQSRSRREIPRSSYPRSNNQSRSRKEKYVRKTGPKKASIYDIERRTDSHRKKNLKRLMALATAGALVVSGFIGYKIGQKEPMELLPFEGSEQTLASFDTTLASSIQRYSTLVQLKNSGIGLNKEQQVELFRLINYAIIPNSNNIVGNYIGLTKSKIGSALNVGDSTNIEILFDVSGQVLVQQKLDNDIRTTYPIESFRDTPIQEALFNLREYNAKFLSNNNLKDIVNRENILIVEDNARDYVNSVMEMANHSQVLEEAQLGFDGKNFFEIVPEKTQESDEQER